MQCQRCKFENMPGQQRCFKCGSILGQEDILLNVHPPRMASWKRPWRRLARHLHPDRIPASSSSEPTRADARVYDFPRALLGLFWGLIPGLGHVVIRESRRVRPVVLAWMVNMAIVLWQIPSAWGWTALGISAGIHAWLALDAGLLAQLEKLTERLRAVLIGFLAFVALYITVAVVLLPYHPRDGRRLPLGLANTFFERTTLAIPAERIDVGDTLRMRPWDPNTPLPRGTLIRHHALALIRRDNGQFGPDSRDNRIIGQIVGLPQDIVEIRESRYYVNNIELDSERYPVPRWLTKVTLEPVRVESGQFFVSSEFERRGLPTSIIYRACLVDGNDIDGRATMLWLPTHRRHRLGSKDPNETVNREL